MNSKWVVSNDTKYVYFNHICRSVRLYCMFRVVERYNNNPTLTNVTAAAKNHFIFFFTYQIYTLFTTMVFVKIRLLFLVIIVSNYQFGVHKKKCNLSFHSWCKIELMIVSISFIYATRAYNKCGKTKMFFSVELTFLLFRIIYRTSGGTRKTNISSQCLLYVFTIFMNFQGFFS